jgi:hypothetical protein
MEKAMLTSSSILVLSLLFVCMTQGCREPEKLVDLGKYCVITHNCTVWKKDFESVGTCIEEIERSADGGYAFFDDAMVACVNGAGSDCGKVFACQNLGHAPEACDGKVFQDRCDGNVAESCGERRLVTHDDCGKYREAMSLPFDYACVISDGRATCEPPGCIDFSPRCHDGAVEYCDDGGLRAKSCDLYGMAECREEASGGGARCVGTGSPCAGGASPDRCEGDVLVYCLNGREARKDCSKIGSHFLGSEYTCELEGGKGECVGSGNDCFDDSETHQGGDFCTGAVLGYCNTGHRQRIPCKALGFDGCGWAPDRGVAWCTKKVEF